MTSEYLPYRGASYLGPVDEVKHLFAVMNDPCDEGQCLVMNVTSIRPNRYYDDACVLDVGDHDFIKHPSYVFYRYAITLKAHKITKFVGLNYYISKEDWDPSVFKKIVDGIRKSDDVPRRIVNYADAVGIF